MVLLYSIINVLLSLAVYIKKHKWFDPVIIYNTVWLMMIILYNLKLVAYEDLSVITWSIILFSNFFVTAGYMFGGKIRLWTRNKTYKTVSKRELQKYIYIMIAISLTAIIPNTIAVIERYGIWFIAFTREIYTDNLIHNGVRTIPYLGCASQAAIILSGIYFWKFGYNKVIPLSLFVSVLYGMPTGSRGYLLFNILYLILPVFLNTDTIRQLIKKYWKVGAVSFVAVMLIYQILTRNRSAQIAPENFMSPLMLQIIKTNPSFYKNYEYFTSPLAVLNEFLKKPEGLFGMNTFFPLYNFLNKFGLNIDASRYQTFYYVPMYTNVGSWLRELIQDFGISGMFLVILIFSFALGNLSKRKTVCSTYLVTFMSGMLIMSFFVWYMREGVSYILLALYFFIRFTLKDRAL